MSDLKGKVAIVTGASKGIGAGIAKGFAAAGAAVVVNYASSGRRGPRRGRYHSTGRQAVAVQGDVSKAADVKRLFEQTRASFGALDVLVNNAGVYQFGPLETVTEKEFHREFDTNVLGILLTIREALKYFGPHGGSVINISSIASLNPTPDSVVYAATKSAVDSSRAACRRNWVRARFASTPSRPEVPHRRDLLRPASLAAISKSRLSA